MERLTEKQSEFIEEIQTKFDNPQWSVSSYPKYIDTPGQWTAIKFQLLDFCLQNNLFFLEKPMFFHVGRSITACEYIDAKLAEHLKDKPIPATMVVNQIQQMLN